MPVRVFLLVILIRQLDLITRVRQAHEALTEPRQGQAGGLLALPPFASPNLEAQR